MESYPHINMAVSKRIGDKLKTYLKANKIKPAEFARRAGLNKENVYKWLKGTNPSDPEDYNKINDFISGKMENVPEQISQRAEWPQGIGSIEERLIKIESHIEVFGNMIAGLQATGKEDFANKVEDLKALAAAVTNRMLDELRKK